jgi:hypothetical protein
MLFRTSGVVCQRNAKPVDNGFYVHQNFPNPVNASTCLLYDAPCENLARLHMLDEEGPFPFQSGNVVSAGSNSSGNHTRRSASFF